MFTQRTFLPSCPVYPLSLSLSLFGFISSTATQNSWRLPLSLSSSFTLSYKRFSLLPNMLSTFLLIFFLTVLRDVAGLQRNGQAGYNQQQQQQPQQRVPILYEAYYPEPRDLSTETKIQEIDKLRELTSELLEQEERLKQLASEIVPKENVFAPRSQVLEYVFSRPVIPLNERVQTVRELLPTSTKKLPTTTTLELLR